MFYFFLGVFLLALIYNFRLLNMIILDKASFTGDFIFALVCLCFGLLIVFGTLRIKHLNNERIRNAAKKLIYCGPILFALSFFSFNLRFIVYGFEWGLVLSCSAALVYLYNIMPEGEPDIMEDNADFIDITEGYFEPYTEEDYSTYEEVEPSSGFFLENSPMETVSLFMQILEKNEDRDDAFTASVEKSVFYLNEIAMFNQEIKPEVLEALNGIGQVYISLNDLNIPSTDSEQDMKGIEDSFENIERMLENSYHNMKGAQAYKREMDVIELYQTLISKGYKH